jgi:hypothetical protein
LKSFCIQNNQNETLVGLTTDKYAAASFKKDLLSKILGSNICLGHPVEKGIARKMAPKNN